MRFQKSSFWHNHFPKSLLIGVLFLGSSFSSPLPFCPTALAAQEQTLSLRAIQSRSFKTTDQQKLVQTVASTLQDMGYIIIRVDTHIGFVTATHFTDDIIEISVTVQPVHDAIIVRASARKNNLPLDKDPEFYQEFFNHLGQALFLNANKIY